MNIETSKKYVRADGYIINESTVEILDEEKCIWLAYASTSTDGHEFPLLVRGMQALHLTAKALVALMTRD